MQIPLSSLVKTRKAQWIQLEILLLAAVMIMTTCASPFLPPTPTPFFQPESPLISGMDAILTENRWRLLGITNDGEILAFDLIQPVYLTFSINNTLLFTSTCNSVGYTILFENKHKYKLIASAIPGKSCGEIIDKQFADVHQAIRSTTEYEIKDAQLILIGEGVQVVLEIDNPQ